jgi:hypothetical protein
MERCRNCGARLSADIDWCGQCYRTVRPSGSERVVTIPDIDGHPRLAFGLPERLLFSALLVAYGVVAYAALLPEVGRAGSTTWGVLITFLGVTTALSVVALWITWREQRSAQQPEPAAPKHVVAIGGTVFRVPELAEDTWRT